MKTILKILTFGKGIPLLSIYLVFSFWMLSLREAQRKTFHEVAVSKVLFPVQRIIHSATNYKNIKQENIQLRQENAKLKWLYEQRRQAAIENRRLRNFLQFEHPHSYPVRLAKVIARDPSRVSSTLVIGLGLKDSLQPGMPVYTPRGVVGKVEKVFERYSTVQLLMDLQSRVSVMENRSRTIGILESINGDEVQMAFPSHAEVFSGDTIVTSGFGGVFPKGLSVGRVMEIATDELPVLSNARIQLFQNPRYLEEVFVMRKVPEKIFVEGRENE